MTKTGENWMSYSVADGLASDTVYDFAFDVDTIWIATHRGISSLVDGQFSGIYTSSKEEAAIGFEMISSYNPREDAILLSQGREAGNWYKASVSFAWPMGEEPMQLNW